MSNVRQTAYTVLPNCLIPDWLGILAGLAVVLVTVGWSFWLAAVGVIVMALALFWLVEDIAARVARKRAATRT